MSESTATLKLNVTTGQSTPALGALVQQTGFLGNVLKATQAEADRLSAILSGTGSGGGASGKSIVQSVKDVSTAINQGLEVLGKFGRGVEDAVAGVDSLVRFRAEWDRLNTAIPTATLDKFRVATKGTVDDLTLLRTTNVAMQGAFHLTAAGVNEVLKAATNLSQEGFGPTVEIFQKLDRAIRTQSLDSLKDFGISLTDASTKAGNVTKILSALHAEANKKINVDPSVDAINKLENSVSNWWSGFRAQVGEVFGYIAQAINSASESIDAAGKRVTATQDNASAVNQRAVLPTQRAALKFRSITGRGYNPDSNGDPDELDYNVYSGQAQKDQQLFQALLTIEQEVARLGDINKANSASRDLAAMALKQKAQIKAGPGALTTGHIEQPLTWNLEQAFGADFGGPLGYDTGHGFNLFNNYQTPYGPQENNVFGPGFLQGGLNDLSNQPPGILNGSHSLGFLNPTTPDTGGGDRPGFLESGFKDFTDQIQKEQSFLSDLKDQTGVLGGAFSTLQSGVSAAVEAAIDGSDSIAKAFAKASSAALKSIAIESATRALYETALGFGDLAWGSPTAALHFKSAAVFTAAAVAAGVGAAALGALGGGSSSSAGSGGVPSGGGGPTSQANNNGPSVVNVYISGAVTAGDYAQLGETVTKAVKLGQQTGRVRSGDNVTVTWE